MKRRPSPNEDAATRPEDIELSQVREVIDGWPSLLWCRDDSFVPWSLPPLTLSTWAERSGIPHTVRPDPIGLLCEPFLDTSFTPEDEQRAQVRLGEMGFSEQEVSTIRKHLHDPMYAYNALVWEWYHLGFTDVVAALGPQDLQRLGASSAAAWCSSILKRAYQAMPVAKPFQFRVTIGDMLYEAIHSSGSDFEGLEHERALKHAIENAYSEPWRHYHMLLHLAEAWALGSASLHVQGGGREEQKTLAWLILFHDYVYRPGRTDNEQASASLAEEWMGRCGRSRDEIDEVSRWIQWSSDHNPADLDTTVSRAFFDADMAILGLGPRRYSEYVNSVRLEFTRPDTEGAAPATVSQFVTRRREFLEGIQRLQEERGRFYFGLHSIHEESLRDNVDRELATLRG